MKNILIAILVIIVLVIGGYLLLKDRPDSTDFRVGDTVGDSDRTTTRQVEKEEVIGQSVDGRDIIAYHFGGGDDEILLVSGIHGGYSWNTAMMAYEAIDYFEQNPQVIPENIQVTVVPSLNPDGLYTVTGKEGRFSRSDVSGSQEIRVDGRFNTNGVDLNRNFDCDWRQTGVWQNRNVSGGTSAFSEPESSAIRDYAEKIDPVAVVVYYSAAGGVFASSCHNGILPETLEITNVYANASGYSAHEEYDFYEITGDMVNWLAREEIPAISVLLTTHEDVEWAKNRAGIRALLEHYEE